MLAAGQCKHDQSCLAVPLNQPLLQPRRRRAQRHPGHVDHASVINESLAALLSTRRRDPFSSLDDGTMTWRPIRWRPVRWRRVRQRLHDTMSTAQTGAIRWCGCAGRLRIEGGAHDWTRATPSQSRRRRRRTRLPCACTREWAHRSRRLGLVAGLPLRGFGRQQREWVELTQAVVYLVADLVEWSGARGTDEQAVHLHTTGAHMCTRARMLRCAPMAPTQ